MESLNGGGYRLGKCHCYCWDNGAKGEWYTDNCDLATLGVAFFFEHCGGNGDAICELNRGEYF